MALGDLFSNDNERKGRDILVGGYNQAETRANKRLNQGAKVIRNQGTAALGEFAPYTAGGAGAAALYGDAIGLGGADGNARAVGAFRTSPGYDFMVGQGLDALDRRAASRGMLASGNNQIDTMRFMGGVADQEYSDWLDRLDAEQKFGADVAGQRAGIRTDMGSSIAGIRTKQGGLAYDTAVEKAKARAGYQVGKDQTAANTWGAVTGGASLGAQLLGF